ncbi:hypothetical protein [Candidatus Chloroploca sp. Khr17]|uniref:hypothetical protein n=1 Tax=Candidatus Chloroploca sp. Khr17 TaxID=2496869 RepID=UPI00101BBAB5|nr:hypothetical protein [Candidatus Chloroploca sp. Khr17]
MDQSVNHPEAREGRQRTRWAGGRSSNEPCRFTPGGHGRALPLHHGQCTGTAVPCPHAPRAFASSRERWQRTRWAGGRSSDETCRFTPGGGTGKPCPYTTANVRARRCRAPTHRAMPPQSPIPDPRSPPRPFASSRERWQRTRWAGGRSSDEPCRFTPSGPGVAAPLHPD